MRNLRTEPPVDTWSETKTRRCGGEGLGANGLIIEQKLECWFR